MTINFSLLKVYYLTSITKKIGAIWTGLIFFLDFHLVLLPAVYTDLTVSYTKFCPDLCSQSVLHDAQWYCTSKLRPLCLNYFLQGHWVLKSQEMLLSTVGEKSKPAKNPVFLKCGDEISSPNSPIPGHFWCYIPNLFPQLHPQQRHFSSYYGKLMLHQCSMVFKSLNIL